MRPPEPILWPGTDNGLSNRAGAGVERTVGLISTNKLPVSSGPVKFSIKNEDQI